jgi:FMN phosphatase YigB (HAD superfamily)
VILFANTGVRKTDRKIFEIAIERLNVDPTDIPIYGEVIRKSFATVAKDFGWTQENAPGHISFITNERLAEKYKDGYMEWRATK